MGHPFSRATAIFMILMLFKVQSSWANSGCAKLFNSINDWNVVDMNGKQQIIWSNYISNGTEISTDPISLQQMCETRWNASIISYTSIFAPNSSFINRIEEFTKKCLPQSHMQFIINETFFDWHTTIRYEKNKVDEPWDLFLHHSKKLLISNVYKIDKGTDKINFILCQRAAHTDVTSTSLPTSVTTQMQQTPLINESSNETTISNKTCLQTKDLLFNSDEIWLVMAGVMASASINLVLIVLLVLQQMLLCRNKRKGTYETFCHIDKKGSASGTTLKSNKTASKCHPKCTTPTDNLNFAYLSDSAF